MTDFTFDRCTPKFLWIPAHRIHKKIPRFQEAHLGPDEKFITYYICRMKILQHLHVLACMWYSIISLLWNDIHIFYITYSLINILNILPRGDKKALEYLCGLTTKSNHSKASNQCTKILVFTLHYVNRKSIF